VDYLARARTLYPVTREATNLAGVHIFAYMPRAGIEPRNAHRVLIELHGGGFSGCWPGCAELESIPVAGRGRIRVISVDYREAPQHHFPAASEDVAAVYGALLKSYRSQDIGIYGCSAGGLLTAEVVAWLQQHGLPRPGAVGIFCAGAAAPGAHGFVGDANYVGSALGEANPVPLIVPASTGYFAGARADDPLVSPLASEQVLGKFPPTLIIAASRDIALSSAIHTHMQLVKQGVTAELNVWDGLFHGFFYNPDVPESQDCYDVILRFFAQRLGGS
jgi:monoterpene epsilon-lactone hydrolase